MPRKRLFLLAVPIPIGILDRVDRPGTDVDLAMNPTTIFRVKDLVPGASLTVLTVIFGYDPIARGPLDSGKVLVGLNAIRIVHPRNLNPDSSGLPGDP